jgi:hypothetical protein
MSYLGGYGNIIKIWRDYPKKENAVKHQLCSVQARYSFGKWDLSKPEVWN